MGYGNGAIGNFVHNRIENGVAIDRHQRANRESVPVINRSFADVTAKDADVRLVADSVLTERFCAVKGCSGRAGRAD